MAGVFSAQFGPKFSVMVSGVPVILGWSLIALAPGIHLMIIGNIFRSLKENEVASFVVFSL